MTTIWTYVYINMGDIRDDITMVDVQSRIAYTSPGRAMKAAEEEYLENEKYLNDDDKGFDPSTIPPLEWEQHTSEFHEYSDHVAFVNADAYNAVFYRVYAIEVKP
jgi:hypothetical protein